MSRQKINTSALATPGRLDQPLVVLRKVDIDPLSVRLSPSASTTMEMIGEGHVEQEHRP